MILLSTIDEWSRSLTGDRAPAVVLGASVNGLSFARSLGRRWVPTLMLDDRKTAGSHTRFATTAALPAPASQAEAWVETLLRLGRQLPRRAVLFPTSDAYCVLVAKSPELREYYDYLLPEPSTLDRIVDKHLQYQDASAAGIAIPHTCFPADTDEARRLAKDLTYPCIVKPYKSHERRRLSFAGKVSLVSSADELARELDRFEGETLEVMIQEIVPGGDDQLFGYLGFWDVEGRERAWLTKRKLRQSTHFGDGSFQEAVQAPEVAELSRKLLNAIGYQGFVGVEFRLDPRDGAYRLMEINPRTVSGNQLAISAGVDFPWLGYLHATGQLGEGPADPFRVGTRYVNEMWDLRAYLRLRKTEGLRFGSWLRSLIAAEAHAFGAWDDPMPLLQTGRRLARAVVRREWRSVAE
jgi:predicted ATP-grasp superfamily ATP-dependent carboligase